MTAISLVSVINLHHINGVASILRQPVLKLGITYSNHFHLKQINKVD